MQTDRQYEAECRDEMAAEARATDEARATERDEETAYCERAARSLARGESEEAFEMREMAAQAAQYRVTDRANAEILRIFGRAA